MTEQRIRDLRREARQINAVQRAKGRAASGDWRKMDADDMSAFERYNAIQQEIAALKAEPGR